MRLNKAKINLVVDTIIGIGFLFEAVSGLVLWLVLPHEGYQGGRNSQYGEAFVLTRGEWLSIHDWFALIIVLGIVVHLALHWRWITCMLRNTWKQAFPPKPAKLAAE